jgi:hypothetical protein
MTLINRALDVQIILGIRSSSAFSLRTTGLLSPAQNLQIHCQRTLSRLTTSYKGYRYLIELHPVTYFGKVDHSRTNPSGGNPISGPILWNAVKGHKGAIHLATELSAGWLMITESWQIRTNNSVIYNMGTTTSRFWLASGREGTRRQLHTDAAKWK